MNRFDRDKLELGWRAAILLMIENRRRRSGFLHGPAGALEYARRFW